jgi:ankyrin repeat protein
VLSPAIETLYTQGREAAEPLLPPEDELTVHEAAAFGRVERLRALLDADPALVEAWSQDGFTPLHLACFAGGSEAVALLVDRGAPLETMSRHEQIHVRPLGTAAFSRDLESARVLLDAGADPNGGEEGSTALLTAAANGDEPLVLLLLERGADRSASLPDGRTPADLAREGGHEGTATLLA